MIRYRRFVPYNVNMRFFRPRVSASENLAFAGMMAGVDAVVALVATFFPFSGLFITIALPLISALAAVLCADVYIPIYLFAAIGASLAFTAWSIQETIFYVIPAIIVGSVYGYLAKKKFPASFAIFVSALVETGLTYLSLPIIQLLYGVDMIAFAKGLLGFTSYTYIDQIIPTFFFAYGLAEAGLSHFFMQSELIKFSISFAEEGKYELYFPIVGLVSGLVALSAAFYCVPLGYLLFAVSIYFSTFSVQVFIEKKVWWIYVLLGSLFVAAFFLFAALYHLFPDPSGLLLIELFAFAIDIPSFLGTLLLRSSKGSAVH
jgi:hypothetical protein